MIERWRTAKPVHQLGLPWWIASREH